MTKQAAIFIKTIRTESPKTFSSAAPASQVDEEEDVQLSDENIFEKIEFDLKQTFEADTDTILDKTKQLVDNVTETLNINIEEPVHETEVELKKTEQELETIVENMKEAESDNILVNMTKAVDQQRGATSEDFKTTPPKKDLPTKSAESKKLMKRKHQKVINRKLINLPLIHFRFNPFNTN